MGIGPTQMETLVMKQRWNAVAGMLSLATPILVDSSLLPTFGYNAIPAKPAESSSRVPGSGT